MEHDGTVRHLADHVLLPVQGRDPFRLHPKSDESLLHHLGDVVPALPTVAGLTHVRLLRNALNLGAHAIETGEMLACLNRDQGLALVLLLEAVVVRGRLLVADEGLIRAPERLPPGLDLGPDPAPALTLLPGTKVEGVDAETDDTAHPDVEGTGATGAGEAEEEVIRGGFPQHVLEHLSVHALAAALAHGASAEIRLVPHEGAVVAVAQKETIRV